ncbi:hypothetical protein WICPIJ_004731 [Wickerhamomyces pijperi]|uniref:DNA excision repair protein ERCC-8 n=1 Tax=Wickerhamomyces pijperi TaxID=599730 RepID=A0A9P8TN04_WICPI|nr:hypothetical protein WICPIJ_004731 [Wickerhamomyces pijperi]
MQSTLLLDQSLTLTSRLELSQLLTESLYFNFTLLKNPRFKISTTSSKQHSTSNYNTAAAVAAAGICCIDFDQSQGQFLLSGDTRGAIKLFKVDLRAEDEDSSELISDIRSKSIGVTDLQWWPNDPGMFLSASYDGVLQIWDTSTLTSAFQFQINNDHNSYCHFSVNTINLNLISVATDSKTIRLVDLRTTSTSQSIIGHESSVISCEWSPTKEMVLASGDANGEVKIWDVRFMKRCLVSLDIQRTYNSVSQQEQAEDTEIAKRPKLHSVKRSTTKAHIGAVNGLKFHENGKTLITTGTDDKIRVWDLDHNAVNTLLNFGPLVRNKRRTNCKKMIVSPIEETDVQYLFYPSDITGEILLFRLFDGKLVSRLKESNNTAANNLCMSYAGLNSGILFTGLSNGEIQTWGNKRDDLDCYHLADSY